MRTIRAVIETPKGSTQKYTYDHKKKHFELGKILPSGMAFPYDFGFIPGTKGEDGDPLDIIIISEFGTFPGCWIECRIIGCIKARQTEKDNRTVRNDRYLAVPEATCVFSDIRSYRDLPKETVEQLIAFFINYNRLSGKEFDPIKISGPATSYAALKKIMK